MEALLNLFSRFVSSDLQKLCSVLQNAVVVPVQGEASPFILSSLNDVVLTQLQDGVLHSMELLQKARSQMVTYSFTNNCK
jgi:hypothetical protein